MTAIEEIRSMIENGEATEDDFPVGSLKREAKAKIALKNWKKNHTPEHIALMAVCNWWDSCLNTQRTNAEIGEADFNDLCELQGCIGAKPTKALPMPEFPELTEEQYKYICDYGRGQKMPWLASVEKRGVAI